MGVSPREFRRFTEHLPETLRKVRVREEEGSEIFSHVYLSADEITNDIDDPGEAKRFFETWCALRCFIHHEETRPLSTPLSLNPSFAISCPTTGLWKRR